MANSENELVDFYSGYSNELAMMKTIMGLSAAVYTEITDVEIELNGLLTFDRAVVKADPEKIKKCNETAIYGEIVVKEALATSKDKARDWQYTLDAPDEKWFSTGFDASAWKTGKGGFGTAGTWGNHWY